MKITPVKGTFDYLPDEVRLRDYLQAQILRTYQASGFERIMTPIIEDLENLDNSDGGDNLNLMFRIAKRGEKLTKVLEAGDVNEKELCDLGLRYDLTLPLTRYYANNRSKLEMPFKVIQMGNAYRAEKPQKGRMREFMQCDIDIIGTEAISSEIELIDTTARALLNIGINNFCVRINDRRILKDIIRSAGFGENGQDSVCITLDKLDKVGIQGVEAELKEKGFADGAISKLMEVLAEEPFTLESAKKYCSEKIYAERMNDIIETVKELAGDSYQIRYDFSLVRGQGYYTGPIFEIESLEFKGSIAGGGRYDDLIGKFLGEKIPATGFSIGFERISSILYETGFKIPGTKERAAIFYGEDNISKTFKFAAELRENYDVSIIPKPKKLSKALNKLAEKQVVEVYLVEDDGEIRKLSI